MAKKIPLRKCIACGDMFPKKELLRIVRTPNNEIILDDKGKQNGRGAYLCKKRECFQKAEKTKAIPRALDCSISEEQVLQLKEAWNQFEE